MEFGSKCDNLHRWIWIWKCRLQNGIGLDINVLIVNYFVSWEILGLESSWLHHKYMPCIYSSKIFWLRNINVNMHERRCIYLAGSRPQHYIFLNSIKPREGNPKGTRRNNNVIMTSLRRRDVVLTSQWRCFASCVWNLCMSGLWW